MKPAVNLLHPSELDTFKELLHVFEIVFEYQNPTLPPDDHLMKVLETPGFMTVVAKINDGVVGGLTAYTLDQYHSSAPIAYLYDLAVMEDFQRKGIGNSLINHLNNHCTKLGYQEVFVQADKEDSRALDFYRGTAISEEEDVSHFYYNLS